MADKGDEDINATLNGKHDEPVASSAKDSKVKKEKKPTKARSYIEQIKKNFLLPTKSSSSKTKDGQSSPKSPTEGKSKSKSKTKSAPKPPSPKPEAPKPPSPKPHEKSKGQAPSIPKETVETTGHLTAEIHKTKEKAPLPPDNKQDLCQLREKPPLPNKKSETKTQPSYSVGSGDNSVNTTESKTSNSCPRRRLFKSDSNSSKDSIDSEALINGSSERKTSDRGLRRSDSIEQERVKKLDIPENKCILDLAMATSADQNSEGQAQGQLEYIYVTNNKLKYMNQNFEKVNAKMYDYKCDVKLKVGDQNYKAHRHVLSNASDYFAAMFSCDMKEKDQDVIELKEISPKGFSAMMDYFYHGYVTIDHDNVEDVIEAARFFHNDWLLECCCDFLIRHLSLENYTAVITLADKYWLGDLRWDIFRFIGENLPNLTQQEMFYSNLSLELLLQFLIENIYAETSERFLLDVILNWVNANPDERKEHLLSLLRQIRFPLMEIEELETLPEEVVQSREIKDAVEDALNYNLNLMGQCLKKGEMYTQRGARTVITVLSFSEEGNVLVYRDPEKPGFFVEQLGPVGLDTVDYQALSQAKLGNFLYAAGGYDGTYSSTNRVFRFDPRYRDWTEVACMIQPRVSFSMCSSDTQLFVAGGVNRVEEDESILNSVEVYTAEDNSWTELQPVPVKCCDAAIVFHKNCLYMTGGISIDPDDPIPLNSTWCLNLGDASGWVPKQNLLTGRQGHSMIPYNDKLLAIGGYTSKDELMTFKDCITNEMYDIETNQWTEIAPTPEHFGHLYRHNALYGNKIFVVGSSTVVANLYVYDIESDTWEECESIGPNMQKLAILDVAYPYS
ncbi:kelch-like protein 36 isoform X1 [Mytilus edulis]|uniref:kelch-like protein 36 isoform X1 n=1 Tax=Mytilus edulis TaxID=6550 RepID=UPI0039EE69FF